MEQDNANKGNNIKEGTFVESMIRIQDLLKYSEHLYDQVYFIQKQIKPNVLNKRNTPVISGVAGPHDMSAVIKTETISGNISNLPGSMLKESERNIFQRLTDFIDKTYVNLSLAEEGLHFIYDTIGIKGNIASQPDKLTI